jgi:hypothetical protein
MSHGPCRRRRRGGVVERRKGGGGVTSPRLKGYKRDTWTQPDLLVLRGIYIVPLITLCSHNACNNISLLNRREEVQETWRQQLVILERIEEAEGKENEEEMMFKELYVGVEQMRAPPTGGEHRGSLLF